MVESWVALAWVITVALIPVAVWAGMQWGKLKERDRLNMSVALASYSLYEAALIAYANHDNEAGHKYSKARQLLVLAHSDKAPSTLPVDWFQPKGNAR